VKWWGNCIGVTGAPFDSFLTLRGLRTLHASHGENAQRVPTAGTARGQGYILPGLPSHLDALARFNRRVLARWSVSNCTGRWKTSRHDQPTRMPVRACRAAGGASASAHPASMTHAAIDQPHARAQASSATPGAPVDQGIEEGDDLVSDLGRGVGRGNECDVNRVVDKSDVVKQRRRARLLPCMIFVVAYG
jgi:cystathionine gamma-synthase